MFGQIPNNTDSESKRSNKLMQTCSKRFDNWGTVIKICHQINSMSMSALLIQSCDKSKIERKHNNIAVKQGKM